MAAIAILTLKKYGLGAKRSSGQEYSALGLGRSQRCTLARLCDMVYRLTGPLLQTPLHSRSMFSFSSLDRCILREK